MFTLGQRVHHFAVCGASTPLCHSAAHTPAQHRPRPRPRHAAHANRPQALTPPPLSPLPALTNSVQAGFIDQYDEKYDRASVRQPVKLAKKSDVEHFNVTTIDDPFIQKFAQDGAANVFATDAIMAMLAACPRSMLPWDIVVTKLDGLLFFDKRDESNFDYLSVSETASELPKEDDPEDINHPNNLSIEATMVQQNFTQQILKPAAKGGVRKESEEEHPFFDDEGEEAATVPASCSYGYRRWQLSEDIMFLARTEMHAWTRRAGAEQKMTSFALNEWDSQQCGGTEWRSRLDSQVRCFASLPLPLPLPRCCCRRRRRRRRCYCCCCCCCCCCCFAHTHLASG